jgi:HPt (histidine-containing phosphotransfer) domain-containing protein
MQTEITNTIKAGTGDEKLYDLCMIEKMCRGNQEKVRKVIQVFIVQAPLAVEEIKSAYKKNDFVVIKKAAHQIRPVLSYYFIVKAEKEIHQIEALAEEGLDTGELAVLIERLEAVVTQVVEQMKEALMK